MIFLDEPTTGLDPRTRTQMWETIEELVQMGSTVLLTTQYMEEADRLCDDIVVIDKGRKIAQGTAAELKNMIGGERVEVVLTEVGDLGVAQSVLEIFAVDEVQVEKSTLKLSAGVAEGADDLRRVLQVLSDSDVAVVDVGLRRPTLDDVFLSLTGHGTTEEELADANGTGKPRPWKQQDQEEGGSSMSSVAMALADGAIVAKRNLIKIKRVPEVLIWTTMSPIMFVLLFAYVFGSSINIPGVNYREYLIAGIFAQTVIFGSTFTGAGLAEDMTKGIIDRFRSLPIAKSAVLIGRTASDIFYNALSITVMSLTGLIVGWRIRSSIGEAILGFLLLLLFSYSVSWIMAYVGLKVTSVEVVNNASFMFIMPLTFIANTFIDSSNLPGPARGSLPSGTRCRRWRWRHGSCSATPGTCPRRTAWPLQNPVLYTLICNGGDPDRLRAAGDAAVRQRRQPARHKKREPRRGSLWFVDSLVRSVATPRHVGGVEPLPGVCAAYFHARECRNLLPGGARSPPLLLCSDRQGPLSLWGSLRSRRSERPPPCPCRSGGRVRPGPRRRPQGSLCSLHIASWPLETSEKVAMSTLT